MPELPEVETVVRTLQPLITGKTLGKVTVRESRLRFPVQSSKLNRYLFEKKILLVRRRAKYILIDIESEKTILIHLGMSGRLSYVVNTTPKKKHDHVVFSFKTLSKTEPVYELRFNDSRRFGMIDVFATKTQESHPRLKHLGIEPLSRQFSKNVFFEKSKGIKQPIKLFLMDAKKIVGIGNIYATEALFRAGIKPTRMTKSLSSEKWQTLIRAIQETLSEAIEVGGTTLRDFLNISGEAGYFAVRLRVYGKGGESCSKCKSTIQKIVQAGRSSFFCPVCQI